MRPNRSARRFLSRPEKAFDGLWVRRCAFAMTTRSRAWCPNDLLDLLDGGIRLTPPDLHGNCLRIFIPRGFRADPK